MLAPHPLRATQRCATPAAIALVALSLAACGRLGFENSPAGDSLADAGAGDPDAATGPGVPDASGASGTAHAALVQQATGSITNRRSVSAALPTPTTPGNLLVVIGGNDGGSLDSVTGGGAIEWKRAAASDLYARIEIWYGVVTAASSDSVTASALDTGNVRLNVTEWSGLVATPADVLDTAAAQPGTSLEATAPSVTTANADLLVFAVSDFDPDFLVPEMDQPWAAMIPITASNHYTESSWYSTAAAPGTPRPAVLQSQNHWAAALAAFKLAP